jgi:hypothetical protein
MHHQALGIRFNNVHSDLRYGRTANRKDVFEKRKKLPVRSDVTLSSAAPYRLQLCTVLGSSVTIPGSLFSTKQQCQIQPGVLKKS